MTAQSKLINAEAIELIACVLEKHTDAVLDGVKEKMGQMREKAHRQQVALAELQLQLNAIEAREEQWRDIHDAVIKDADKAHALLRWAENEMRYAGWGTRLNDNHGRTDVYEAITAFLK